MPPGDERSVREAVRAFLLTASALTNPVPRLMADLTAPGERLRELERDPPLAAFSPFDTLPDDIAGSGGDQHHPPVEVAPPEAPVPVFSFRQSSVPGSQTRQRERAAPDDPVDAPRGHFNGPGTAQVDSVRSVDSAHQEPRARERSETTFDYGAEGSGPGARLLADPMSLLDGLAEDALGPTREVPLRPANTPLRATRSREPEEREGGAGSVEGPPVSTGRSLDATDPAHLVGTAGSRQAGFEGTGIEALIGSLVEDLLSPPARIPDGLPGSEANASKEADPHEVMVTSERSAFAALHTASDRPDDSPYGAAIPDDEALLRFPEPYADPEVFADLINDVLVRQARRHGVDLS